MDAELRPHRSWSAGAFKWMLIAVIAINTAVAIFFVAQGAFPVAGFLGLDVLALYLAFRFNYRAARQAEFVRLTPERLCVERRDANGSSQYWSVNPLWARVAADAGGVLIRTGGDALRIGQFLPPKERAGFAQALDVALYRAKRGA